MLTKMKVIIPENRRGKITDLNFEGVGTYVLNREGELSVIHADETKLDVPALEAAAEAFAAAEPTPELPAGEKPEAEITLLDVIAVLKEKNIIEKKQSIGLDNATPS